MFTGLPVKQVRRYRCKCIKTKRLEDGVFSRQERIPGFKQDIFSSLHIGVIGAGGLGGEISEGLVRKGVGQLTISDHDDVDPSNLNRQLFSYRDIGKNKGVRLAKNLSASGYGGTVITGVGLSFQEAVGIGFFHDADGMIFGVDDEDTRDDGCHYGLITEKPVVFVAVSRDGNNGMVFLQEPGKACYGCAFGHLITVFKKQMQKSCAPDPAVKDILKVVAGFVLYSVDSLFMDRRRNWNYREIYLAGFVSEKKALIQRKKDCPFCGKGK